MIDTSELNWKFNMFFFHDLPCASHHTTSFMQKYGDTPLIVAAQKGSALCVALLTGLTEADITHQNSAGYVGQHLCFLPTYNTNAATFEDISDALLLLLRRCLTTKKLFAFFWAPMPQ